MPIYVHLLIVQSEVVNVHASAFMQDVDCRNDKNTCGGCQNTDVMEVFAGH